MSVSIIIPDSNSFQNIFGINSTNGKTKSSAAIAASQVSSNAANDYLSSIDANKPILSADKTTITITKGGKGTYYSEAVLTGTNLNFDVINNDTFSISMLSVKFKNNETSTTNLASMDIGLNLSVINGRVQNIGVSSFNYVNGGISISNNGNISLDTVNEKLYFGGDVSINYLSGSKSATTNINHITFSGNINVDMTTGLVSGTFNSLSAENGGITGGLFKASGADNSNFSVTGLDLDITQLFDLAEGSSKSDIEKVVFSGTSDTLNTFASISASPEGIEVINCLGSSNIDIVGNSSYNTIVGNSGANDLDGMAGADSMSGGLGNDTYHVDNYKDQVVELSNSGNDTVISSIGFTLPKYVDNLQLSEGKQAIQGFGNSLSNVIIGNSKTNVIYGGGGSDILDGQENSDLYIIKSISEMGLRYAITDTGIQGQDVLRWSANESLTNLILVDDKFSGIDKIEIGTGNSLIPTDNSGVQSINIDASKMFTTVSSVNGAGLDISGNNGINKIAGTRYADTLSGFKGNDALNGGGGSDKLIGGKGADALTGGTGVDIFKFAAGDSGQTSDSIDKITDFTKSTDLIDFNSYLSVGGVSSTATSAKASINSSTGIATFATGSGLALADALSDIQTSFNAGKDTAGKFAFFKIPGATNYKLFISDGSGDVSTNDVVIDLIGVSSISSLSNAYGDLKIF